MSWVWNLQHQNLAGVCSQNGIDVSHMGACSETLKIKPLGLSGTEALLALLLRGEFHTWGRLLNVQRWGEEVESSPGSLCVLVH